MGRRRHARETALQILYQIDMTDIPHEQAFDLFYEHFDVPAFVRPFSEQLVQGVAQHKSEIDGMIVSASQHWRINRMSIIDRNVLRIALFEMLYCPDIPLKVSLNEAVDLGKTFGSEESGSFINGILDHLLPELRKAGRIDDASEKQRAVPE
ncbi:MAG: transcription antitermination factor NusB [Syntrophobacteraceae bacterium]